MNTVAMPNFRQGLDAIEEAATKGGGGSGRSFKRFSLDDGESVLLRFITPPTEWTQIEMYRYVPTKQKPPTWKGDNWPKMMSAISRSDPAFAGMGWTDYIRENIKKNAFGGDLKPSQMVLAYACVREEVRGDGSPEMFGEEKRGKVIGYRDAVREVTIKDGDDEKTITEKDILLVEMPVYGFYDQLTSFARAYDDKGQAGMLGRDVLIKRVGSGSNDTKYMRTPLDPTPGHDLADPETAAKYEHRGPSITEYLMQYSSDEYYGRFFDPNWTEPEDEKSGDAAPAAEVEKPSVSDVTSERMAELSSRLKGIPTTETAEATETPASSGAPMNFT